MSRVACLAVTLLLLAAPAALAQQGQNTEADEGGSGRTQQSETTLYDRLLADYKDDYLAVGALVQTVVDVRPEGDADQGSQIVVAAARLSLSGTLDERFGYIVSGDFSSPTPILDARVSYRPADNVRLAAGRYKAPFSRELLTSAANIDFVNRARVVRTLAPGRVVGVGAELGTETAVTARAGVFNAVFAEAIDRVGSDEGGAQPGRFLFVGRLAARTPAERSGADGVRLSAGANAVYETTDGGPRPDDAEPVGDRALLGADARLRAGRFLFAAEGIVEVVDTPAGSIAGDLGWDWNRAGGYVTAGVDLAPAHRVLARLDAFENRADVLLGYNVTLSDAAGLQLNVGFPTDSADARTGPERDLRFLANVQIAF